MEMSPETAPKGYCPSTPISPTPSEKQRYDSVSGGGTESSSDTFFNDCCRRHKGSETPEKWTSKTAYEEKPRFSSTRANIKILSLPSGPQVKALEVGPVETGCLET